jgi:hypothetical protein
MSETTKTVVVKVVSSADMKGVDAAKKSVDGLKKDVAAFEAKLDGILVEADTAGQNAGAALTEGVKKGSNGKQSFGFANVFDVGGAAGDARQIGSMIGDALARGMEAVMDGRSFLSGVFGDYDPAQDPQAQKIVEGYRKVLEQLNAKPEAGGIIEWLDEVKQKAAEAADEIEHLAQMRGIAEKTEAARTERGFDEEEAAIKDAPNLTDEQKDERLAGVKKKRIFEGANQKEQARMNEDVDSGEQLRVKRDELEAAKKSEEELRKRAEVSSKAGMTAQEAWNKTDEGKERGETLSDGSTKWSEATKMPEDYRDRIIRNEGRRQGIDDLVDPKAEGNAFSDAQKRREKLEAEVSEREKKKARMQERHEAERGGDQEATREDIYKVDMEQINKAKERATEAGAFGTGAQEPGRVGAGQGVPTAALEQSANSVGQSGERMSGAVEQMVSKVDGTMSKVASTMETVLQRLSAVEANASRLQASVQSQRASGQYG